MAPADRDIGAILAKLEHLDERLDTIERRLTAGDARFKAMDIERAASGAQRDLAMKVGGFVMGAAVMAGGWALTHVPFLRQVAELLFSQPKP